MKYPRVSVLIATYNRGSTYLPLALHSVLSQDYSNFEVIVIDDASTDCTPQVLDKFYKLFRARNIEFSAFRLAENSGYQNVPYNMGIYNAAGDYIAYLDDDNEWMPTHLSRMMEEFESDLSIDIVYCWRKYINEGDHKERDIEPHPPEWDVAQEFIRHGNGLIDNSDIIHSRGAAYLVHSKFGYICDPNERRYGDLSLQIKLIAIGCKGKQVPEELTRYRWHGENLGVTRPVVDVAAVSIEKLQQ
jgi:glycosyltransferase involved in cell wall biosynthesis